MRDIAFGIDFGTTNSLVSVWGQDLRAIAGDRPIALWDRNVIGNRPHPSVVWYGPNAGPVVGRQARDNMASQEHAMGHVFVRSIKRRLGNNEEIELVGGERKPARFLQ